MMDDIRKKQDEYRGKNAGTPQVNKGGAHDLLKKQASEDLVPCTPRNVFEENTPLKNRA